jgi:hypothetical protein
MFSGNPAAPPERKEMFDLAQTVWPRFGGDRANRSLLSIAGPHTSPRWRTIALPTPVDPPRRTYDGVVILPDDTLRVCYAGRLTALTVEGEILWQIDLCGLSGRDRSWVASLPTVLQTEETLLFQPDGLLLVDNLGNPRKWPYVFSVDDFGGSPNLTCDGHPVLTCIAGEVALRRSEHEWQELGVFGYDIVTPAVYPDNSLAISGYAGKGFCRVGADGKIHWRTSLKYADLPPTLNQDWIAAVGSLNERCSAFFTPDGERIGVYSEAALFSVTPDGGWVAVSKQRLARLSVMGKEIWSCSLSPGEKWSQIQPPLVDKDGFLFVRHQEGFLCFDPHGSLVFEHKTASPSPGFLSIIAPEILVYVQGAELFISGH